MLPTISLAAALCGIDLRWVAPPECPPATAIEARIMEYAGDAVTDADVTVDAEVSRVGERWQLRLAIARGEHRELRELDDAACEGLAESAAVFAAIALGPEHAQQQDPTPDRSLVPEAPAAPTLTASPSLRAKPTTAATAAPVVRGRVAPPMHVSLRASGGASIGWRPLGGGVALALALYWQRFRIEIEGDYAIPRHLRLADLPTSGGNASGWSLAARGCFVLHPRAWLDIPLCAGAEAGQLLGRPIGLVDGRRVRLPWVGATAMAALRFVVHPRVALWLAPALVVPITRPTLRIANESAPLFLTPILGARAQAGIEVQLR